MNNTYNSQGYDFGALLGTLALEFTIIAIIYAVTAFLLSKIFQKMGIDSWRAWVPVYNNWVFLEAGGLPGALSLLALAGIIPFIGSLGTIAYVVLAAIAAYRIGLAFNRSGAWVVAYIFVPILWFIFFAIESHPFNKNIIPGFKDGRTPNYSNGIYPNYAPTVAPEEPKPSDPLTLDKDKENPTV